MLRGKWEAAYIASPLMLRCGKRWRTLRIMFPVTATQECRDVGMPWFLRLALYIPATVAIPA